MTGPHWEFHDGSPEARTAALRAHGIEPRDYDRERRESVNNTVRGILVGLAVSFAFWGLAVALPVWLHYGLGVGR